MTATDPIPPDAFAAAVESLDTDAFATFVAEVYGASADAVAVDGPRVTVSTGDRRTELLVRTASDGGADHRGVDAVVVASESLLGDGADVDVVTPADLRQRLLYALPPTDANAIAERALDVPVRSETYDAVTSGATADGEAADGDAVDGRDVPTDCVAEPVGDGDEPAGDESAGDEPAVDGSAVDQPPDDRSAGSDGEDHRGDGVAATGGATAGAAAAESATREASTSEGATDASTGRFSPRNAVAVVAVVALLVAAAGAGFVAGTAGLGGPDGIAGLGDGEPTGSTNGSDDGGAATDDDGTNSVSVADGEPTGEAARNTALSPTCERSALQVVQIQMNALRYNDDETNDGIRTLRAFATPENRDLVGSVEAYAELFETARYAPMLTYDTAQYSVPEVGDGTATVDVVTRENGTVTGRYEFRLELIPGGTEDADATLGAVDGCWMTGAVASSSE